MPERAELNPDQARTPLIDAIRTYQESDPAFFRIPGHRFERGADPKAVELLGEKAYRADLTEAEGLDDLHQPTGPIREAEKLAADLYGSLHSWFLINGTTCGNEAMILAVAKPGDKILLPRNAHKSYLMGLILSGAVPVWMEPVYYPDFGFYGEVRPEEVMRKLEENPDAKGVYLTSPTYYGVMSDIRQICTIAHEKASRSVWTKPTGPISTLTEIFRMELSSAVRTLSARASTRQSEALRRAPCCIIRGIWSIRPG